MIAGRWQMRDKRLLTIDEEGEKRGNPAVGRDDKARTLVQLNTF